MSDSGASPVLVLGVYGFLILLASLAGGWFLLAFHLTHTRLQTLTSLVAGMMLGVGLLHLLPHAFHQLHSLDGALGWMMGGFLVVFFIQRFFHFHHHDVPEEASLKSCGCPEDEPHPHAPGHLEELACGHTLAEQSARRLSWTGATLGLLLHSILDGVAVAAAVQAESHAGAHGLVAGLGTFLVVLLHKPFDAMAVGTLLARGHHSRTLRHVVNGCLALAIPLGIVGFYVGFARSGADAPFLGAALAFSAGTFLCIAASDLLPELQFHAHDRWKLSAALLAGLGISVLMGLFEHTGHDRHDAHSPAAIHSEAGGAE